MKYGSIWRGFGLAALYIGILLALVLVQFPKDAGFVVEVGALTLKARAPAGNPADDASGGPLASAILGYQGFSLEFSADKPLEWVDAAGASRRSAPLAWERLSAGFRIRFEGGPVLSALATEGASERASLSFEGAQSVSAAWSLGRGARLSRTDQGEPVLSRGASTWTLSQPDTAFDRDAKRLNLDSAESGVRSLVLVKVVELRATSPASAFIEQAPMEAAAFAALRSDFVGKAWTGLSTRRWNSAAVSWGDAAGGNAPTEAAAVAYVAEAFARGAQVQALERLRAIRLARPSDFSWLSAPYLGNIVQAMASLEAADLAEVRLIERQVAEASVAMFERERFLRFLLDRAPYSLARSAFAAVQLMEPSTLSGAQAVGALEAFLDGREFLKPGESPFDRFEAVPERVMLPLVRKTPEGFFYQASQDGSMDPRLGLRAGLAMIRYGELAGKPALVGVGQKLVSSLLGLADADGFVPAKATVREGLFSPGGALLPPEAIYDLVAANPYYPHEVSFYGSIGPGAWAWTSSPQVAVVQGPAVSTYTFQFPVGFSHFSAVYGVAPYQAIRIHGLDYRMDEAFERYDASGFNYKRASNSLYLKLKHRQGSESVVFAY